jgi:PAS domain S-box-containing protein/putative nucleotidyltransferase with HDIG domain
MKKKSASKDQEKKQTTPGRRDRNRPLITKPIDDWNLTESQINSPWDAWIVTDLEFKVLNWNTTAEKMYGWKKRETLNYSLIKFIKTEYPMGINSEIAFQKALENGHWQEEVIHNRKDGSLFAVKASISLVKDNRGKPVGFIVVNRDLANSRKAEEELRKIETSAKKNNILLKSIMESPQGIVIFAIDTNFCYTAFTVAHKNTMKAIWGVEIEIGMNMLSAISDPLDREKARKNFELAMRGEFLILIEEYGDPTIYRTYYEDRYSPIFDETGSVSGVTVYVTDITERKQFEEELRQRTSQLESLRQVGLELTAELNVEKLLQSITARACELLGNSGGGIYLYRTDIEKLELVIAIGAQNATMGILLGRGEGLSGKVWELGQPIVVDDYENWTGRATIYEDASFKAVIGVPIRRGEEFLGVLTLLASPPQKFNRQDVALLELFAGHAAVAIHNARLYQNVQNRLNQFKVLYETSKALSGEYDLNVLLQTIVENAMKLLNSSTSSMYLFHESDKTLELVKVTEPGYPVGTCLRLDEGVAGRVAKTRQPIRIENYSAWDGRAPIYNGRSISAVLEVPMLYRGELIGVLTADEAGASKRKFTEEDEHLLSLFASQAAGAIHSARLYSETRRRAQEFTGLYETTRDLSMQLDLSTVLAKIIERATKLLNVQSASINLFDTAQADLELVANIGPDLPPGTRRQLGDGLAGRVAQSRNSIIVEDYQNWEFRSKLFEGIPYGSIMGVPLLYGGHLLGVLDVAEIKPSTRIFNEADLRLLSLFAGQAASAIDNAKLFNSLQRSNTDLTLAYDATIEGWSRAMDLRDKETEGHTVRVSELALILARVMGIEDSELIHLRRGGLLHDIGKLGVPDNILLKDEDLTDKEWEIMRKHPTYAYEMLSQIDYLKPALTIPYCHHEKWDGTGYPRGLKGEDIPLVARIFALADVWDALLSDRSYRKGWSTEKATEYIKSQAGIHFDPAITPVFLDLMQKQTIPATK